MATAYELFEGSTGDSAAATRQALADWLIVALSSRLGVEPSSIDPHEPLQRLGFDSAMAIAILSDLQIALGRSLSPTLFFRFPTIDALTQHLVGNGDDRPPESRALAPLSRPLPQAEPIAIVGMACCFPRAPNLAAFARMLREGVDAVTEVPPDRWSVSAYYDPDPLAPGKMSSRWGGFIDSVDLFDAQFFGISSREAAEMDPQQRLALEVVWQALEDAGLPPGSLKGSRVGVFFGVIWHDYALLRRGNVASITPHTGTGQALGVVPNRISYTLGLGGPSIAIDTACSSSLVALHLACQSLRDGESSLAIVGGVNLMLAPDTAVALTKFGGLSPDGRCKTFDERANGFVRGEGAGVVVLKPLSQALARGDRIYCIIRGSAVNNDGESNGLTAPNPRAQEDVLREACARAGVRPETVRYVEAHGTGTALGDPIEAQALGAVYGAERPAGAELLIGSVKTNIGHLEGAAGIAGVIKVALAIANRELPPSLHYARPNPLIPFDALRLQVQRLRGPWPERDGPVLAGVSSFGWGGTNGHVILEGVSSSRAQILAISAPQQDELRARAERLREVVLVAENASLPALCRALALELGDDERRLAVVFRSREELDRRLAKCSEEGISAGMFRGRRSGERPGLVFVFPPQGPQWLGMGQQLLRDEVVFRHTLEQCDLALRPLAGFSLIDELTASTERARFQETSVIQPLLFGVQVGLAALFRSWGIEPDAVVGHSLGELAAAHVAGVLDLEDAVCAVFHFSRLQATRAHAGAMALTALSGEEAGALAASYVGRISVACYNSPRSTVLSGDVSAIDEVIVLLSQRGIFCSRIRVDVAAHSAQMDPILEELCESIRGVEARSATIPVMSSAKGAFIAGEELGAPYWSYNLRQPVQFSRAIRRLSEAGYRLFLEVGPHPILTHSIEEILAHEGREGEAIGSLRRHEDERTALLDVAGALYVAGLTPRWDRIAPACSPPIDPVETRAQVASVAECRAPDESAAASRVRSVAQALPISAKTLESLLVHADDFAALLGGDAPADYEDICYTASVRSSHFAHRLAIVARSRQEARRKLEEAARQLRSAGATHVTPGSAPQVVFVFGGQGPQWAGMGCELLRSEPVFRAVVSRIDRIAKQEAGFSLIHEFEADDARSRMNETEIAQPALFALQVGLSALLGAWGVAPAAVVGHSVGEVAAAYQAGVLDLSSAVRLVVHRGRIMQRATGIGKMASVAISLPEAERLAASFAGRLSVAASNGPRATVLSGESDALAEACRALEARGVSTRLLSVNYAFHSPQMDPFVAELSEALLGLAPRAASIPIFSTVTGRNEPGARFDAAYWAAQIREPVRFQAAVEELSRDERSVFLEIGPHPVLASAIVESVEARARREAVVLASLRRREVERSTLLEALVTLYRHGCSVTWPSLFSTPGRVISLPSYRWQKQRCWMEGTGHAPGAEPSVAEQLAVRRDDAPRVALFEERIELADRPGSHICQTKLSPRELPYPATRGPDGDARLTGAGVVEMVLAAGAEVLDRRFTALHNLTYSEPLTFTEEETWLAQILLSEQGDDVCYALRGRPAARDRRQAAAGWVLYASGTMRLGVDPTDRVELRGVALDEIERCTAEVPAGAPIAGLSAVRRRDGEALATVDRKVFGLHHVHMERVRSILLDACFQLLALAHAADASEAGARTPRSIRELSLCGPLERACRAYAVVHRSDPQEIAGDVVVVDAEGRTVLEANELVLRSEDQHLRLGSLLHELRWIEAAAQPSAHVVPRGAWLLLYNRGGLGIELKEYLAAHGDEVVEAIAGKAFQRLEAGRYEIDPLDVEQVCRLLRETSDAGARYQGIVHLLSLDAPGAMEMTCAELEILHVRASISAIHLAQVVTQMREAGSPRLYLVTRGAVAARGDEAPLSVEQAPLWGLGSSIRRELPETRYTLIDLDPAVNSDASVLGRCLRAVDAEVQIALRGDARYVARLSRRRSERSRSMPEARSSEAPLKLNGQGIYLITGGLGGVGLKLAEWLVSRGARRVALLGRRAPSADAERTIRALADDGAQITVLRADISVEREVERVIAELSTQGPLAGVMHAAGVIEYREIIRQDRQSFAEVTRAKVLGGWALHRATARLPLEFFVLFSSVSSFLFNDGLSAYAAANAFLDALAHHRRREGLTALCINWGPWAGLGMAANEDVRMARLGLGRLSTSDGLAILERAMRDNESHLGAFAVDWVRHARVYAAGTGEPLIADLLAAAGVSVGPSPERSPAALQRLEGLPRYRRWEGLLKILEEVVAMVLGLDPSRPLDRHDRFRDMGFDSFLALELRRQLRISFGDQISLPATLIFDHPTIEALGRFIGAKLPALELHVVASGVPEGSPKATAEEADAQDISEEQTMKLLTEELASLPAEWLTS